jgi:predicted amidohydrolase YtcJ
VGKEADIIVFSANPMSMSSDQLKDFKILMTLTLGEVVYCDEAI